jgi:hypothetical protein
MDRIFLLFFFVGLEAFLGSHPRFVDIGIDIDHELEDQVKQVSESVEILLNETGDSFNDCDSELNWLVSDCSICKIVLCNNRFEHGEYVLEVLSEILGFNFSQLIEFDKSVFKNSLVLFLESFHGNLSH